MSTKKYKHYTIEYSVEIQNVIIVRAVSPSKAEEKASRILENKHGYIPISHVKLMKLKKAE